MNKPTTLLMAASIIALISSSGFVYAQEETITTQVNVATQSDDNSAIRTTMVQSTSESGKTASGVAVETLEVTENTQTYNRAASGTTLNGDVVSGSVTDTLSVDGNTASRDYNRTVVNATTGETVSRSRASNVIVDEGSTTWTREDTVVGNEKSANSAISGSVVANDDGSITYDKDRTVTNTAGEEATRNKSVNLSRDEAGNLNVDRENTTVGFEGQTVSKNKNGQFSTNEDGSGSFMSSADVNAVDSDGVALAGNREASGEWQANSEGGRDYSGSRSATSDNGQNTAATTNAKTTRDGNGNGTFQSVRDRQNGDGTTDRFERRASVKRDGNGVQRSRSKTRTRGD